MDIEYELHGIRFRWNEGKAKLNIKNHEVAFEQAAQVFFDPFVQYQDASRNNQQRDGAVGCDFDLRLLFCCSHRNRRWIHPHHSRPQGRFTGKE